MMVFVYMTIAWWRGLQFWNKTKLTEFHLGTGWNEARDRYTRHDLYTGAPAHSTVRLYTVLEPSTVLYCTRIEYNPVSLIAIAAHPA